MASPIQKIGRLRDLVLPATALVLGIAGAGYAQSSGVSKPQVTAQKSTNLEIAGLRRLNEGQYVRSIEQIFGPGIKVPGRFEPSLRDEGLLAIGDSRVTISSAGIEQYELRAREISKQVVAKGAVASNCSVDPAGSFDQECARSFFQRYGRQLYRRPLHQNELVSLLALGKRAADEKQNPMAGYEVGLARLLMSTHFIFRVERTEAVSKQLDDYSLATRISFLLWDAPPDEALLDAVEGGDFRVPSKLDQQVSRMISSPRFEQGVRSFFSDMLGFEHFQGLAKDQAIYPKFNSALAKDAQEQMLRTIVDQLVERKGDYRDIFTTRNTFINRGLAALYKIPAPVAGVDGWAPYTFPASEPRGGILSLAGFLMLDPTHEGRSSPTIRGKNVREMLLCQPVPQPPPNVDFAIVQDVANPLFRTARQRLSAHRDNPACAGCHALTDPIGLSIENYDAIGNYRTHENGAPIDVSGDLDGNPYTGLPGLSQRLSRSPVVPSCLVQRSFEYGVGRPAVAEDNMWLESAIRQFATERYRLPQLMRTIATSPALRKPGAQSAEVATVAPSQYFHRRLR